MLIDDDGAVTGGKAMSIVSESAYALMASTRNRTLMVIVVGAPFRVLSAATYQL